MMLRAAALFGAVFRCGLAAPLAPAPAELAAAAVPLPSLNIDPETVVMTGLGDSADFAHQFHIAFAALVRGACVFSGQPFNCAVAGNAGDSLAWHAKILANGGAASSTNDHCKSNPDVVDVGSLVVRSRSSAPASAGARRCRG